MAIYRPPRSPWRARLLVAAAGFVIGAVIVFALLPDPEPSSAERAAAARTELIAAEGTLEIVQIEYAESVKGGEVVAEVEYEGALAALERSRERYEAARSQLTPAVAEEIDSAFDRVQDLVEQPAPAAELGDALEELSQLLEEEGSS